MKQIFDFKINKGHLLVHTMSRYRRRKDDKPFPIKYWRRFEDNLWHTCKNMEAYHLMFMSREWAAESYFLKRGTRKEIDLKKQFDRILKKAIDTPEFKRLYKETQESLKRVQKTWRKNQEKVLSNFKEVTRLPLPRKSVDVYIVHPKIPYGRAFADINALGWRERHDWGHYNEVYLCHELLHLMTDKKLKDPNLMHAIIELATDSELRIRLNKKGKYLEEGHKRLKALEKALIPFWKEYLETKEDIFDFEKKMMKIPKIRKELKKVKNI